MLSLLFITSLGWAEQNQCTVFDRFVEDFITDSGGMFDQAYFDQHVQITFRKNIAQEIIHPNAIAVCYPLTFPLKIQIDPEWWYRMGDYDHWSVLYHEIAHCGCGEDHPIEASQEWFFDFLHHLNVQASHAPWLPDGCPKTLMYPIVVGQECIYRHEDEYVKELFRNCQKVLVPDQIYRYRP